MMKVFNPYNKFQGSFVPNVIMECRELSQSAKLLWGRLVQYSGRDGRCFPSISALAKGVGLSEDRTRKIIAELRDKKFILVTKTGRSGVNSYKFLENDILAEKPHNVAPGTEEQQHHDVALDEGGQPVVFDQATGRFQPGNRSFSTKQPVVFDQAPIYREKNQEKNQEKSSCPGTNSRTPKKKKFWGEKEDVLLAKKIYQAILIVNATIKKPNTDRWANDIRLMRIQDGRSLDEIWRVFDWANRDQFWQQNVLSPGALRKHFSKLAPKALVAAGSIRGVGADVMPASGKTCSSCVFWEGQQSKKKYCRQRSGGAMACDCFEQRQEVAA